MSGPQTAADSKSGTGSETHRGNESDVETQDETDSTQADVESDRKGRGRRQL